MTTIELARTLVTSGISNEQSVQLVKLAATDSALAKNLELCAGGLRSGSKELVQPIKQKLLSFLPAEVAEVDELAALLSESLPSAPKRTKPAKRTTTAKRKPAKRTKPAKQASTEKRTWTGQAPISDYSGNPLPWIVDCGASRSGELFFNVGRPGYGRSIGAQLEVWREVLANADELLADLEEFASE